MSDTFDPIQYARSLGYSEEELRGVPMGLVCHGCGNPVTLAELQEGEAVLDLGSGGGLDAFPLNLLVVRETTFPMAEQDERLKGRIVSIGVEAYK